MTGTGYATLWEFTVAAARQAEFEAHYGPDGTWARLFSRADGYLGTELLRDRADPLRYLTIDRW
jgi:heme-degrading monooxygenase HmoA